MTTFARDYHEDIRRDGKEMQVFKLYIDGCCPLDEFRKTLAGNEQKSLNIVLSRMEFLCENQLDLPRKLLETIKLGNGLRGFVFKEQQIRIYCLMQADELLIVNGGRSAEKEKDCKQFAAWAIEAVSQLKTENIIKMKG